MDGISFEVNKIVVTVGIACTQVLRAVNRAIAGELEREVDRAPFDAWRACAQATTGVDLEKNKRHGITRFELQSPSKRSLPTVVI